MSNTKIFGANHGIATANVIPDNNATALVIQDTAGEQFMKITTTDNAEQLELGVGAGDGGAIENAGLIIREVDGSLPELQICSEMGFIDDTDTMMRLKTANTIAFKTAGSDMLVIGPTDIEAKGRTVITADTSGTPDDLGDFDNYALVLQGSSNDNDETAFLLSSSSDTYGGSALVHKDTGGGGKGELSFYTKQSTAAEPPVKAMTLTDTGCLKIGTDLADITSPNSLHVRNDSVAAQASFQRDSGVLTVEASGANTTLNSNVDFRVQAGSAVRQCIDSSTGNVGFGTCSATAEVETVGHIDTALTGTFTATNGDTAISSGSSTVFTTQLHVGSAIKIGSEGTYTVAAIASDTALTLDSNFTGSTGSGKSGTTDGGELFAVKTGDSKSVMAVNSTGVLTLSSSSGVQGSAGNIAIGDAGILDAIEEDGVLNTIIAQRGSGNWALSSAANNVIIGFGSGFDITNAQRNVAIGTYALDDATSTQNSVAIGTNCGRKSGDDCVYIGHSTGTAATGASNTVIGKGSFSATCSGTNNVAIGHSAMSAFTGSDSIAIGKEALDASSSIYSTAVGYQCLTGLTGGALESNSAFGYRAGLGLDTGQQNLFLGSEADTTDTDGNNQIAIGHGSVTDGPNKIRLGNSSIATCNIQVDWTVDSDERIKENIQDADAGLEFINALRPVSFTRKHPAEWPEEIREKRYKVGRNTTQDIFDEEGNLTRTEELTVSTATFDVDTQQAIKDEFDSTSRVDGLIAQEVKAAVESLGVAFNGIDEAASGKMGIQYATLVVPLIKAVQELTARIEQLEGGD